MSRTTEPKRSVPYVSDYQETLVPYRFDHDSGHAILASSGGFRHFLLRDILPVMKNQGHPGTELQTSDWEQRFDRAGLGELIEALKQGFKPVQPLAAQILWFAQPAFGLFGRADAIGELARSLADDNDHSVDHVQHG